MPREIYTSSLPNVMHRHYSTKSPQRDNRILEDVHHMFVDMEEKLKQDPTTYVESYKAMLRAYGRLKTDSALVSAIRMFGRYSGVNLAKRKVKSKAGVSGGLLQSSGPSIPVQPSAISRRRLKLGGRRKLNKGRPTKQSAMKKQAFSRPSSSAIIPSKKKRVAAPHSLGHAVTMCQSLGKTHSAK
ncbi:uncharacterized protein LOC115927591 [Strongylocentrotus purpuratus]|uniref:Uncharacterized protein n=1 Tax=Strongylocentrotus purpuratus TaxID=7668 RepID=A0A7M7T2R4_STRPU|nr:uncharacterized protein LOC115927591 [Strongylocentrotus purpuratus]